MRLQPEQPAWEPLAESLRAAVQQSQVAQEPQQAALEQLWALLALPQVARAEWRAE